MKKRNAKNDSLHLRSSQLHSSQKGQVLIEAVLLLTLIIGLWSLFSRTAKQAKWFESMISGPWTTMSGMIENGVWESEKKAQAKHPNHFTRVVSYREQEP